MAFPAIATQFIFIKQLKISPVGMAFAYSLISLPWTIKPVYGFVSDKYAVFDWGKRRPYVFYAGLILCYMYVVLGRVIHEFYLYLASLIFCSFLLCFADVATDSITVELVKNKETESNQGILQSNNWIGRALGTVTGSFFGGMAFSKLDAETVYKLCGIFPFLMACVVWDLPKSDHTYENVFSKLWINFKQQKELALILILISIAPNYGTFYTYYLTDKLKYTPTEFTWLSMSGSLAMLAGVMSFRFYFRKFYIKRTLQVAVCISVLFRLPQLLVVTGVFQKFWLVLCDGVVESYSYQLISMPLIVYTAKRCNDGCEGSLFALMKSISNLSNILGDQLGAIVAGYLNVTEKNFDNLKWLMVIAILGDFVIPMLAILRMFSSSSENYSQLDRTPELRMIDLTGNRSVKSANKQDSSAMAVGLDHTSGSLVHTDRSDRKRDSSASKQDSLENMRDSSAMAVGLDHTLDSLVQKGRSDRKRDSSEHHHPDRNSVQLEKVASSGEIKKPTLMNVQQVVAGSNYAVGLQTDELTLEEAGLLRKIEENYSDEIEVDLGLESDVI